MSVRTRLILTLVAISLLMALPAIYAATQLNQLKGIMEDAQRRHGEAYIAMGRLQARLAEFDRLQRTHVATPSEDARAAKDTALSYAHMYLTTLQDKGYAEVSAPAAALITNISRQSARIDDFIRAGRNDEATAAFERMKPQLAIADGYLRDISDAIDEGAERHLQRASLTSAAATLTTLLALGVAVFLTLALGAWITRNMVRPITQLRGAMAQVAAGDFHVPDDLPYDRRDEIGHVSRSFRGMTGQLEELDQLKAEFMSISTHELKTPINVISGYAELMHERVFGDVNQKQEEALSSIREQTRVLTQMVNQLLDMSRLEAGGLRVEIQEVDLPELFERLERTFQALARKQDVGFDVELDGSAPRIIPGDSDRLRDQVLGNIISNALKFTPAGGTVSVRGRRDGEWLNIEVEDSGTGIPAEQLPHVFNKFYQVGEHARSKGAGLGLAIAYEVISGHGGEIMVKSTPDVGTCFTILLPISPDRAERAQQERRSRANPAPMTAGRQA